MLLLAMQFGCISCLGELKVSMGWLVCVFQWAVCVWFFCGDSVDQWLCGVSKTCVDIIELQHVIPNNVTF